MVRLAVTTTSETYERLQEPLGERAVSVDHLQVDERAVALTVDDAPWNPTDFDVGYVYPSRLMEGGVADPWLDVPWVNGAADVLRSRNKGGVLSRLAAAGVSVPESVLVSNPVDESTLREVFDRFDGPVVVKPNSTTRGVGVARADDLDSFLGIVDYLGLVHDFVATGDKSFLVQEYLRGARDLRVMVIDGTYAGAVERRLPDRARDAGQWKHNVHRGAVATGIQPDASVRRLAETVAAELDLALVGVDILVTDDRALVSETNARPTIDDATKYEPGFFDRLADLIKRTAGKP